MASRRSSPRFVGRQQELDQFLRRCSAVLESGSGTTALVTGEPGIGKSRFCHEISHRARAAGWHVLSGSCDAFAIEARPLNALQEMVPELAQTLEQVAPELLATPAWKAVAQLDSSQEKRSSLSGGSLVELATNLFRDISSRAPLLVIFDDLHWASESTEQLIRSLHAAFRRSTAILVGAYREAEVSSALRQVLAEIHRNGKPEVLRLQPLTDNETELLATTIVGASADYVADACRRSGGNAFFLEELLASPDDGIAPGLREVVLARLGALPAEAAQLVEAACLETDVSLAVLADMLRLDSETAAAALDAASARGLLMLAGGRCSFRHALIRETIYDSLPPGRRTLLHERMADALERLDPERVGEAARHWRETDQVGRSITASMRAGFQAEALGAMPEAASQFLHAVRLYPWLPGGLELRWSLTGAAVRAAIALGHAGDYDGAARVLEDVLSRPYLSTRDQALLWVRLGEAYLLSRLSYPKAAASLRRALGFLGPDIPPDDQLIVLYGATNWLALIGFDAEAREAGARADLLAGQLTTEFSRLILLFTRMVVFKNRGDPRALELARQAIELRDRLHATWASDVGASDVYDMLGLLELNLAEGPGLADYATQHGFGWSWGLGIEGSVSHSLVRLGRWTDALERFELVRHRVDNQRLHDWCQTVIFGWGAAMIRTGNVDEVIHWVRELISIGQAADTHDALGEISLVRVEQARIRGDVRRAIADLEESRAAAFGHVQCRFGDPIAYAIGLMADLSDDSSRTEFATQADTWIDWLRGSIAEFPTMAVIDDVGVFIEQAEAERARLLGRDSAEVWAHLAARWDSLPRPYHAAYTHYRAAFALLGENVPRSHKTNEPAAAHLGTALETCRQLGAVYLEREVTTLMHAAGITDHNPSSAPASSPGSEGLTLTQRELEVLRLLVDGSSNGQIAIRLGISLKTASVHVSNILRKLEVDNRVEAAVRATRLGLVSPAAAATSLRR